MQDMELHLSLPTTVTSIITIIIIISAIAFLVQILKRTKLINKVKSNSAAPQAEGAWPIIGHLHLLGGSRPPQQVLGDMADKYGPIFTIKLGVHQALIVSSADTAKECFTTNDKIFATRPKAKALEIMGYNYAMIGFAPYGPYWRQVRKIIMLEILSPKRVELLQHVLVSEVNASVKDIYDAWEMNKESKDLDMVKVDMQQWFGNLVLNVMVRIISGKRFALHDEEGVRLEKVVRKFFELLGVFLASDFIPFMKYFDLRGYEKEMKIIAEEMDKFIEGWLQDRKSWKKEAGEHQYFMDVLISVLKDANKEDYPGYDHDTVIKATCLSIIVAGSDTTSVTLTWALSLLLNNPNALKTVQEEIHEQVGRHRPVEESDIKKLVYLDAVIKETLRLYPAGPLGLPHESMEDCIVNGYEIPKGTRLLLNIWKLHRDPVIWPDPNKFKPERFLTSEKNDFDYKGNHFEFLPFGSGRRMCPGIYFATQILPLTLANLIQQFMIEKPSNEPIDTSECSGLTTNKALPLEVLLAPRLPLKMCHADI